MVDNKSVKFPVSRIRLAQDGDGLWKVRLTTDVQELDLNKFTGEQNIQVTVYHIDGRSKAFLGTFGGRRQDAEGYWIVTLLAPMSESGAVQPLETWANCIVTLTMVDLKEMPAL